MVFPFIVCPFTLDNIKGQMKVTYVPWLQCFIMCHNGIKRNTPARRYLSSWAIYTRVDIRHLSQPTFYGGVAAKVMHPTVKRRL